MPPATKNIPGGGVEVVTAMLVTVIVVVLAAETTRGVFARVALAVLDIVSNNAAFSTSENIRFMFLVFRIRHGKLRSASSDPIYLENSLVCV